MTSISTLVFSIGCLLAVAHASTVPTNLVQDIKLQEGKLLRCWEPVKKGNTGTEYVLSDPVFPFCSLMVDPRSFDIVYVNGVPEDSDDYTNIHNIFKDTIEAYGIMTVCLQEAFEFSGPKHPAQTTIRCLCKRSGCNIPKPLIQFMEFNKHVIPQIV
uniref:Secreted protein n=1 Tax=Caenorhabditis tropicalis TaxID=1561998 RepID=A0A1I7TNE1_9PELO